MEFPSDKTGYPGELRFTLVDFAGVLGEEVSLYMPAGALFADRVEYENQNLAGLGIAAEDGGGGLTGAVSDLLQDDEAAKFAASEVVKMFSERAGAAARARNKTAPNPNTRALFKQVSLRSFQFNFKLIPTNEGEAQSIKQIIKFFRTEMYPKSLGTGPSGGSLGYKFPNRFEIQMFYDGKENDMAPKIAPSYLESFSASYNPTGQTMLQTGGGTPYFAETDINLTFTESQALDQSKIAEGF